MRKVAKEICDGLSFLVTLIDENDASIEINANELGGFFIKLNQKEWSKEHIETIQESMVKLGWIWDDYPDEPLVFVYSFIPGNCPC